MAYFLLNAGHGGGDPGAVNGARLEKNDNLKLCLKVGEILSARGHRVEYFRTDDRECSAGASRKLMEEKKANMAVAFHRNAFSASSAGGCEVWCFKGSLQEALALDMQAEITKVTGMKDRGVKTGGAAWISSAVPSVQPEIGFITNAEDNRIFDEKFNDIALSLANSLEKFFPIVLGEIIARGTTTSPLNIRLSPKASAESLGIIPMGGLIDIYYIENGWAKIKFKDKVGYSSIDYMKIEYLKKDKTVSIPDIKIPYAATEQTVFEIIGRAVKDLIERILNRWEENE